MLCLSDFNHGGTLEDKEKIGCRFASDSKAFSSSCTINVMRLCTCELERGRRNSKRQLPLYNLVTVPLL